MASAAAHVELETLLLLLTLVRNPANRRDSSPSSSPLLGREEETHGVKTLCKQEDGEERGGGHIHTVHVVLHIRTEITTCATKRET